MKNKLLKNQAGFGHILILVVSFVGVSAAIGFGGYKVYQNTVSEDSSESSTQLNSSDLEVQRVISAAEQQNIPQPDSLEVYWDLSTPIGTANHILYQLKLGKLTNTYSYITPRLMFKLSSALGLPDGQVASNSDCANHPVCRRIQNENIGEIESNYIGEYEDSSYQRTGSRIDFNVTYKDGRWITQHARYGGEYSVKLYMLPVDNGTWVLDKVEVNGVTF